MNDSTNKDQAPLDHWLKEAALLPDAGLSGHPSPAVWEGIQAARAQQRRRKRFIAWWWTIGTAAGIAGILLLFHQSRRAPANTQPEAVSRNAESRNTGLRAPETIGKVAPKAPIQMLKQGVKPIPQPANAEHSAVLTAVSPAKSTLPVRDLPEIQPLETAAPEVTPMALLPTRKSPFSVLQPIYKVVIPSKWKAPAFSPSVFDEPASSQSSFYTGAQMMVLFGSRSSKSLQTGWLAGYRLNKHWSVESGLHYFHTSNLVQHDGRMRYRTGLVRMADPQQQILESAGLEDIETQLGEVTLRYTLSRDVDQPIPDQEWVPLRLQTREQSSFWRIPVLLRFQSDADRWYWAVAGGGGINLPAGSNIEVQGADTPNGNVRSVRAVALGLRQNTYTAMLHGEFQLASGYRFSSGWSAELAPSLQFGPNRLYLWDSGSRNVFTGGLQFRIMYEFK